MANVPASNSRVLAARIAAHSSWASTSDRAARTAAARDAFLKRFEDEVDPDRVLPEAERVFRAEHARKTFYLRMAQKSVEARKKRKSKPRATRVETSVVVASVPPPVEVAPVSVDVPEATEPSTDRALCPACGRRVQVRLDGLLRVHRDTYKATCRASGTVPAAVADPLEERVRALAEKYAGHARDVSGGGGAQSARRSAYLGIVAELEALLRSD